jgi:hypothetical protein
MSNVKWFAILAAGLIALLAVSTLAFSAEASAPATAANQCTSMDTCRTDMFTKPEARARSSA